MKENILNEIKMFKHIKYLVENNMIETSGKRKLYKCAVLTDRCIVLKQIYTYKSFIKFNNMLNLKEALQEIRNYISDKENELKEIVTDIYITYSKKPSKSKYDAVNELLNSLFKDYMLQVFKEKAECIYNDKIHIKYTLDLSAKQMFFDYDTYNISKKTTTYKDYKNLTSDDIIRKAEAYIKTAKQKNQGIEAVVINFLREIFGIDSIFKKTRKKEYVIARQLYVYFKVKLQGTNVSNIAKIDHSTAIYSLKKIEQNNYYKIFVKAIEIIYNELSNY